MSSACACGESEAYSSTSTRECSSEELSAGCVSQPAEDGIELKLWRGSTICFRREGEAQLTEDGTAARA